MFDTTMERKWFLLTMASIILLSALRYQLHHQPLADLIRQRYKWTWAAVFCSVNFKSGGLVYSSVYKFIHEQLPTGNRLSHRESDVYKARCYRCDAAMKTLSTFFSAHPSRDNSGGNPSTALLKRHITRLPQPICMTSYSSACTSSFIPVPFH
jgi:hypothetical protein